VKDGMMKELLEGKKYPTDLILVMALTVLGGIGALILPDGNVLRIVLGILMIAFFPGYALVSVFWPEANIRKSSEMPVDSSDDASEAHFMDYMERVILGFGLSIVIVSITGMLLHFTDAGITLNSIVTSHLIIIVLLAVVAVFRRRRTPIEAVFCLNLAYNNELPHDKFENLFTIAIAISLVLAGITLAYSLSIPSVEQRYSTLFILNVNGTAGDYPTDLNASTAGTVIIGILCHEHNPTKYTILAGIEGANGTSEEHNWNRTFSLNNTTLISRTLSLNHQESFEEPFSFLIAQPGTYKLTWQIYINDIPTEYSTHLWVNIHAD
jgi:uncharacterized membrane protein